jgi:acyl-CoA synthetase (NDP forming)
MLDSALRTEADAAMLVLDYPAEFTGERKECDLLLELYCKALQRHGKTGFVTSAFPNCCRPCPRAFARGRRRHCRAWKTAWRPGGASPITSVTARPCWPWASRRWCRCARKRCGDSRLLNEWESKQALRGFGLPVPNGVLSSPQRALADAALGYPLVLKAVSAQLPHKTEAGAVALNLRDAALSAALEHMRAALPRTHPAWRSIRCCWSPWPAAAGRVDRRHQARNDFGLALVIGAGGILVELLKDSAACCCRPPTAPSATPC